MSTYGPQGLIIIQVHVPTSRHACLQAAILGSTALATWEPVGVSIEKYG